MKIYECTICNFRSPYKTNYNSHLKTKKHLNKIKNEKTTMDICPDICPDKSDISDICPDKSDIFFCNKKVKKSVLDKKKYSCPFCDRKFTDQGNMSRHKNYRCKLNPNLDSFKKIDKEKKTMIEKFKEIEEKNKELKEELYKVKQGKIQYNKINNGNIAEKIINITNHNQIQILNGMKPVAFLNKYFSNTPSLDELIKYIEEEYITENDAYQIEKVENAEIQDPKTRLKYLASAINSIISGSTKRLIKNKNLTDSYCVSCVFLNDGSMRKYLQKGLDWENSGDLDKLQKLVCEISNQTIWKHKLLKHRPPSKDEEIYLAKEILKHNNWSKNKPNLIENINEN